MEQILGWFCRLHHWKNLQVQFLGMNFATEIFRSSRLFQNLGALSRFTMTWVATYFEGLLIVMSLLFPVFNKALHFEKSFTSSTILQFVLISHIFSQFNIEVLSYIFGFQLNFYIMYFNCSHVSAYCVNSYNDSMLSLAQIIVLWEHFLNLKRGNKKKKKKKDLLIFLGFQKKHFTILKPGVTLQNLCATVHLNQTLKGGS